MMATVDSVSGEGGPPESIRQAVDMLGAALPLAIAAVAVGWSVDLIGAIPGFVLAVVLGIGGGIVLGRRRPEATVLALLLATVLLGSPIVADDGRYLPALACMIATLIALAIKLSAGEPLQLPARPVFILLVAYVVMGTIATITSIDTRLSVLYLGGIVVSLGVAFVAAPTLLSTATGRLALVVTAGAIGLALAATSIALWILGPIKVFGESIGIYLVTEFRVADVLTGLIIPRASGPYLTPGYQALNLAIGLFALLAIRPIVGRRRPFVDLGIALVVVATLLTMSRGGWLVAATGCLVIIGINVVRGMRREGGWWNRAWFDRAAIASLLTLGFALGFLLANAIGADARYDIAQVKYGDAAAGSLQEELVTGVDPGVGDVTPGPPRVPIPVRGGAESSSRGVIWSASLSAIVERPLTGYGPGTNAEALAPFLVGPYETYRGLTSHSTWLRTALEMGVGGFLFLIGIVVAAGWVVLRRFLAHPDWVEPSSTALIATSIALVVGQLTETLLLGGLTFASLYWATAIGMLVARPAAWQLSVLAGRVAPPVAASTDR